MCVEMNIVWDNVELPVNHDPMCVDCRPSECPTTKQVESPAESIGAHVLDDRCARASVGVGR